MEKKTYQQPATAILRIETQQMIAQSPTSSPKSFSTNFYSNTDAETDGM